MCGICGILNYQSKEKIGQEELERMNQALSHRGPDDSGYYLNNQVGLAHRRLSIIDLKEGHQPLFNEDKSLVLVYNGEIYNYQELRASLIAKGHKFSTHTDAEVIVHLYEELKEEFVTKLRGMFAFALWDKRAEKMVLVRDRVGIKPLFYAFDGTKLAFASEIKGILAVSNFSKRIDYAALHDFLSFMTTTGEKTIFEGIHRLLPAQMLIYSKGKIQKRNYWEPFAALKTNGTPGDFLELLKESIKCHLVSDVPVGAFLSGGLDSSIIVALMSRFMPEGFKTFSVGFSQDKYYNELPYARIVAKRFRTKHYEYVVNPDIVQILPKMIRFFDEPFAVSSALPTYLLAQLARDEVKVVLTGDGADELIAGYNYRYMAIRYSPLFDKLPLLKSNSARLLFGKILGNNNSKVNKFYAHLNVPHDMRYFRYLSKFQEEEKQSLYSAELRRNAAENDSSREFMSYYDRCPDKDMLNKWLYVDFKTSLPDEMLTKVDRMTMAFGLEARVPFLDHILAEYLYGLPSNLKLRRLTSKYILRKAIKDLLPKEILERPKHGFEVPLNDWIRGELKDYVKTYLNEKRIKKEGFFKWESVKRILDLHSGHKFNYGHQIWMLLTFGIWHEQYFN